MYTYYKGYFESQGKEIPSIFVDFLAAGGQLVVSDPDILQELFVTKSKFVDKQHRARTIMEKLIGRSILLEKSTEEQSMKRKRLSAAFYKDKMTQILQILVKKTYDWTQKLKQDIKDGKSEKELNKLVNDHVTSCIMTSVFGETQLKQSLQFQTGNGEEELSLGICVGKLFFKMIRKQITPLRQLTQLFDRYYIGKEEQDLLKNLQNYRVFLQKLIEERKEQMKDPNHYSADFLTLLLSDDLYQQDDELMKDEISTFMLASTQTTATLITNTLYYYEQLPDVKVKLRNELSKVFTSNDQDLINIENINISVEQWIDKLGYDQLQEGWKYLYLVIQESLRIEPPVRSSVPMQLRESMNICGYNIDTETPILVHLFLLHRNPKEWQNPDKFIPERFDPQSTFYLTPDGRKRKSHSFAPFLGGRRICLGKTFAENIAKLVIPIFISELEFKFKKEEHYKRKPPKSLSTEINVPIILSAVKGK
ncbi:cytochrome p450 [Stylonychia lemnae]|uniref:Cytochrome p450 n=1 Tax=Stylonychia lemnae TaxID=5949 RepID=A0A078ARV6_STYLE|nr:cytochrome p450 [Stylonychia lemnae]|eukprot:CDW83922.1 cytochrome p450 [Stylonychia lemnae]